MFEQLRSACIITEIFADSDTLTFSCGFFAIFKKMKRLLIYFILWQGTLAEVWKGVRYAEPVERWRAPVEYAQQYGSYIFIKNVRS